MSYWFSAGYVVLVRTDQLDALRDLGRQVELPLVRRVHRDEVAAPFGRAAEVAVVLVEDCCDFVAVQSAQGEGAFGCEGRLVGEQLARGFEARVVRGLLDRVAAEAEAHLLGVGRDGREQVDLDLGDFPGEDVVVEAGLGCDLVVDCEAELSGAAGVALEVELQAVSFDRAERVLLVGQTQHADRSGRPRALEVEVALFSGAHLELVRRVCVDQQVQARSRQQRARDGHCGAQAARVHLERLHLALRVETRLVQALHDGRPEAQNQESQESRNSGTPLRLHLSILSDPVPN